MIEDVGFHRPHNRNVVDDLRQMRKQFGNLGAALAMPRELAGRSEQLGVAFDEREPLIRDKRFRNHLPMQLGQTRLGIEQFQLTRTARHEQEDHVLRPRRVMRRQDGERIGAALGRAERIDGRQRRRGASLASTWLERLAQRLLQQRRQRHRSNPHPAVAKKMPAARQHPQLLSGRQPL